MSTSDYGFTFNGHHSSDFGLRVLAGKTMTLPAKNKVTVTVPYSNGVIDLSQVYDNNTFGERTITFKCRIPFGYNQREELYTRWTQIVNWLMSTPSKVMLADDVMTDYYYMAEVQTAPTLTESSVYAEFDIVFQCDPFRYHPANVNDLWDPFNFELDYAQETGFKVSSKKTILLFNIGATNTNLAIETDNDVIVYINGQKVPVVDGQLDSADAQLKPGKNEVKVSGSGTVSFNWTDEVI